MEQSLSQWAELGAIVVLKAIVLWLVMKYLPARDREFLAELKSRDNLFIEEMQKHSLELEKHNRQLNRLVGALTLLLDDDDKAIQQLSDHIFRNGDSKRRRRDDDG